jgi:hypothetical protein
VSAEQDDEVAGQLADDALRLLAAAESPTAAEHTRTAAAALRRILDRHQADLSTVESSLREMIVAGVRDDPDLARDILRCVNSDVPLDPAGAPDPAPAPRRVVVTLAVLIALGGVAGVAVTWGPSRSVDAYCETYREQGKRLHDRLAAENLAARRADNVLAAMASVASSPREFADFFADLEEVAPDEIAPDVATLRDGWGAIADRLGDSPDPLSMLSTGLVVGLATGPAERRVEQWTSRHC